MPTSALASYLLFPGKKFLDPDTVNALMPALVGACIWIPYMLVSKRVKITFVEHKSA